MTPIDALGVEIAKSVKVWSNTLRKAFERATAEDSRLRSLLEQMKNDKQNKPD